jgi:hypothetical protein
MSSVAMANHFPDAVGICSGIRVTKWKPRCLHIEGSIFVSKGGEMKRPAAIVICAAWMTVPLSACSTSPQIYSGPPLPASQVSTLLVGAPIGWNTALTLDRVDDMGTDILLRPVGLFKSTEYSVLPGQHELTFDMGSNNVSYKMTLTTLPAHRYRITRTSREKVSVIDETTGMELKYVPTGWSYDIPGDIFAKPAKPKPSTTSLPVVSTASQQEIPTVPATSSATAVRYRDWANQNPTP